MTPEPHGPATCPRCGLPIVDVEEVVAGRHPYADTLGGHEDRHTLVIEAAERAATGT